MQTGGTANRERNKHKSDGMETIAASVLGWKNERFRFWKILSSK